jgi:hypothetical protein
MRGMYKRWLYSRFTDHADLMFLSRFGILKEYELKEEEEDGKELKMKISRRLLSDVSQKYEDAIIEIIFQIGR